MALAVEWTIGLDEEQKAAFEEASRIAGTNPILRRLVTILQNRDDRTEVSEDDYDIQSWSHKQAHRNGARSERLLILKLLSFIH